MRKLRELHCRSVRNVQIRRSLLQSQSKIISDEVLQARSAVQTEDEGILARGYKENVTSFCQRGANTKTFITATGGDNQ